MPGTDMAWGKGEEVITDRYDGPHSGGTHKIKRHKT